MPKLVWYATDAPLTCSRCCTTLQAQQLHEEFNIDIRLLAIASSSRMLLSDSGINLSNWRAEWGSRAVPADMDALGKCCDTTVSPRVEECCNRMQADAKYGHSVESLGDGAEGSHGQEQCRTQRGSHLLS